MIAWTLLCLVRSKSLLAFFFAFFFCRTPFLGYHFVHGGSFWGVTVAEIQSVKNQKGQGARNIDAGGVAFF